MPRRASLLGRYNGLRLTEAALERNIEVGTLLDDAQFSRALAMQFDGMVAAGSLRRVPGI